MHFMADCSVILNHELLQGISQRNLRVVKFRGSAHSENESPFVIGDGGLQVADTRIESTAIPLVTTERVTSGIERLDTMLGGGYYRGASVLITGLPGAAKSTLAAKFAEAACLREEPTLFVSFDSDVNEVVRNVASVNIHLKPFVESGLLRMVSARSITCSAEIHLMRIKNAARDHGARCVVIDPVSALSKVGSKSTTHSVAERLLGWTKTAEITLICTSLLDETIPGASSTQLQISTLADTWLHLSYLVLAGERNRGLSIIKSRGTWHSNQVRELLLNNSGVALTDVYTAGGEVLMGTARWEKEAAERAAREEIDAIAHRRQAVIDTEEAELEIRLNAVQRQLDLKRAEKVSLAQLAVNRTGALTAEANQLRAPRGIDKS
jgi:circadian clock protein KaiC